MGSPRLYVSSLEEIRDGRATDIYFERTRRLLARYGEDSLVRIEAHAYSLPRGYSWGIYAGLEEALAILEGKPITVYSLPEGTLFREKHPLMIIESSYSDFSVYETAVLGVLRFSTSIATKAARVKMAAGDRTILYFGLRATHPAVFPAADRAAYIGGADGVSGVLAEKYLGLKPRGTMPHALIIVVGDQEKAWRYFAETFGEEAPVIALVDTFYDEREESLMAAKLLGERLYGVRLDTPSSRRGKMREIVEEVRWTLDINGYGHVKIFVSGGVDEDTIKDLRDVVDGFGVGTSITMAPSIDISMDIVEVYEGGEWVPKTKRGKLPGSKQLYRCRVDEEMVHPFNERPSYRCSDGKEPEPLLVKYMENGRIVRELPSIEEIRGYVLSQLEELKEAQTRVTH